MYHYLQACVSSSLYSDEKYISMNICLYSTFYSSAEKIYIEEYPVYENVWNTCLFEELLTSPSEKLAYRALIGYLWRNEEKEEKIVKRIGVFRNEKLVSIG